MTTCPHCRHPLDESRPGVTVCPACGKSLDPLAMTIQADRWKPTKQDWDELAATVSPEWMQTLVTQGFLAGVKPLDESRRDRVAEEREAQPKSTGTDRGDIAKTIEASGSTVPELGRTVAASDQTVGDLGATVDSVSLPAADPGATVDSTVLPSEDPGATIVGADGTVPDLGVTLDSSQLAGSGSGGSDGSRRGPSRTAGRSDATFDGKTRGSGFGSGNQGGGGRSLEDTLVIQPRVLGGEDGTGAGPGERPDYSLDKKLGEGGMGVVYAAWQQSIRRMVALKMLKKGSTHQTTQREKFLAEAVVTGELEHPNIVPIYDLGRDASGAIFYAMKRVQGTPWDKLIQTKSLPENVEILMKVADAIRFAHNKRVIHRDLKPENVMLGDFGEVLVMDWGLAVTLGEKTTVAMGGTPAYMAPEMVLGPPSSIGTASDIYLLGAILYEVVTGQRPHGGGSITQCLMAAGQNEIRPTEKSGELIDIAMRAMATRPQDRYASVLDLQDAIRAYQSHTESISLSTRADEDLDEALRSGRYETFSRALFGYQESLSLWGGNRPAKRGARRAALEYARCAEQRGDFELGLSLLDESIAEHRELADKLRAAQEEQEQRKQRLQTARRAGAALVGLIFVIVTGAFFWIRAEAEEARRARDLASVAEGEARSAERIAQEAFREALNQKMAADMARTNEEREKMAAIAAQIAAEEALEIAEQQRQAATEAREAERVQRQDAERARESERYESYIAKIGLAAAKVEENAFDRALTLLEECPENLRNWEWGRLKYLCTRERTSVDLDNPLESISLSSDGTRLAAGGWGGDVWIGPGDGVGSWTRIPTGSTHVFAVAFSPDGQRLAVGSNRQPDYLTIWDVATGTKSASLVGHRDSVLSIEWSRDGTRLLTGSYDQAARIWDVESGESRELLGHDGWVWSARFSPDENQVLTASQDGSAILWETATGRPSPPFLGHQSPILVAAFAPSGDRIATGDQEGRVLLWRPEELRERNLRTLVETRSEFGGGRFETLEGHRDAVRSIAFSGDGDRLLTTGNDNEVLLWDLGSAEPIKRLRGHGSRVAAAVFNADETEVISAAYDHRIKFWPVQEYSESQIIGARVLQGHRDSVLAAAFDPTGQVIVSASRDRSAVAWDVQTGQPLRTFTEGHAYLTSAARFLPGGQRVITAAIDNTARIWDREAGTQLHTLSGTGISAALAVPLEGDWIATGSDRKSVILWDLEGNPIRELTGFVSDVTALAISGDGKRLLTGDAVGRCRLLDIESGGEVWESRTHSRSITRVAFVPGTARVLTASTDHSVAVRDAATGLEDPSLVLKHPAAVTAMVVSRDGRQALTACADQRVRLWDLSTTSAEVLFESASAITGIALSPDRRLAAFVTAERQVRLWDLMANQELPSPLRATGPFLDLSVGSTPVWSVAFSEDSQSLLTVGGAEARLWDLTTARNSVVYSPQSAVSSVAFSPSGDRFVTGSWDHSARVWDLATGRAVLKVGRDVHKRFVNAATFSPDGKWLATADDRTVRLWDPESGNLLAALEGHEGPVLAIDFAPDGSGLLSASADRTIRIWDPATAQVRHRLEGHTQTVLAARFSPDGRLILSGSEDTTARLWDAKTGKPLEIRLEGHTAGVAAVAFTPDGQRVVTGGKDTVAKLWDPKSGKEILTLSGHTQELTTVDVSPDGRTVLTGSRGGRLILWPSVPWTSAE